MREFPIGFYKFHKDEGLNFQLNRFYASGIISYNELMEIGQKVDGFDSWIKLFTELAEKSEKEGEILKSALCYRAAQFYTLGNSRDEQGQLRKKVLYEKCFCAFEKAYAQIENLVYERVPFETGYLPVYKMIQKDTAKGTIVIHGGYDSFMQEFVSYIEYFFAAGYNVFMFEGPGQGEVLCRQNIKMTPEWNPCVSTILDYYYLTDVTLIGISLGGYLATQAAAYEPRVKRLIMFDLIYDFYGSLLAKMDKKGRKMIEYLTNHPKSLLWKIANKKMNRVYFLQWLFEQGYFIYEGVHNPCEYFNYIKRFNTRKLSFLIKQDTLVMAGASDIYTVFLKDQMNVLLNAKSAESRLFTKEEHADHHCQMGNSKLALDTMRRWIEKVSKNA